MRVLLDHCVVRRFGILLQGHEVVHASKAGLSQLENGELIAQAERQGFEVMITVDKNLMYQQNLASRETSIIVLNPLFVIYDSIAPLAGKVLKVLQDLPPGAFVVIEP